MSLAKKLYLHDMVIKEEALKYCPGTSWKLPKGMNLTAIVLYDLLFGVERYVSFMSVKITRIRPDSH